MQRKFSVEQRIQYNLSELVNFVYAIVLTRIECVSDWRQNKKAFEYSESSGLQNPHYFFPPWLIYETSIHIRAHFSSRFSFMSQTNTQNYLLLTRITRNCYYFWANCSRIRTWIWPEMYVVQHKWLNFRTQ